MAYLDTISLVRAILYAARNGADVINMSWGGPNIWPDILLEFPGASYSIEEAIKYAHKKGVIMVAASGNAGTGQPMYPAGYPEVISVAATNSIDSNTAFTNFNDPDALVWPVAVSAPGLDIISTLSRNHSISITIRGNLKPIGSSQEPYLSISGTSMAAPYVSGLIGLILSQHPHYNLNDVRSILRKSGDPTNCTFGAQNFCILGFCFTIGNPKTCTIGPRINAYQALITKP